ncbi:MAG: DUF1828 domain-containing protein [Gemmatales bacterium]|nr:DUF1828 domain-containing protein [Gemmatales bacterium]MDW7995256.1 DUF1828 domain-containing protein [Gemmatales bacterium]
MNDPARVCQQLVTGLAPLFQCSVHNSYVRIRTPFLYPDGDILDLYVVEQDGNWLITDLGETLRWLKLHTTSPRLTSRQMILVDDACQTHGVEFLRGQIEARCPHGEALADAVFRVAQAAMRIADLWHTFRLRIMPSFAEEVADFLQQHNLSFERNHREVGKSGREWQIDFLVHGGTSRSLVELLTTENRATARRLVEHVLALWFDLQNLRQKPLQYQFVSLFDDTSDVWAEEDFRLLEQISTIQRWSDPEGFLETLRAA